MATPPAPDWGNLQSDQPAGAAPAPPMPVAPDYTGNLESAPVTRSATPDPWSWARQAALGARDITDAFGLGAVSDWMGIPKPQGVENIPHDVMSGVGGAMATAMGGEAIAARFANSVAGRVGATLAAQPVRQAVVGGLSGAAQGTAAALGAPSWAQTAAAYGTALASGGVPGTGRLIGGAAPTLEQQTADLARQYGIPVYPGQLGSRMGKYLYSLTGAFPGSGAQEAYRGQLDAMNAAVGRSFGASTEAGQLTPAAMQDAKTTLNNNYQSVGQQIGSITPSAQLDGTIRGIESMLPRIGDAGAPLQAQINNIRQVQQANGGQLPASFLLNMRKSGSDLTELAASTGDARQYAQGLQTALDTELRSKAGSAMSLLDDTDRQWMNMRTAERAIVNGDVQPGRLANIVKTNPYQLATYRDSTLRDLGQVGQLLRAPPESGSAERLGGLGVLMSLGEAGGHLAAGEPYGALSAIGTPLATWALGAGANRAMRLGGMTPTPVGNYYARALVNPAYINPLLTGRTQSPAAQPAQ